MQVMFTLTQPSCSWMREGAVRHTCAVGGVYLSISQTLRAFAKPEVDIR
jgi:hypothetical protein